MEMECPVLVNTDIQYGILRIVIVTLIPQLSKS